MVNVKSYILMVGITLLSSCQIYNERIKLKQLSCLVEELSNNKLDKDYIEIRNSFNDTFNNWITKGIREVSFYKNSEWKLDDAVFFNENKTKALLLILQYYGDNSPFDYAKIIGCEKINSHWNFYFKEYPNILFKKEMNNNKDMTYKKLSELARYEIISDGYFFGNSCVVNYKYIEKDVWFSERTRIMHINEFLTDTIPQK